MYLNVRFIREYVKSAEVVRVDMIIDFRDDGKKQMYFFV
jgi:hypothetical protein